MGIRIFMVFGLTCVTLFSIGWCEPKQQHGTSENNGLIFKGQPKTLLSRTKRQNEFSAGGIFMRIVSMVAILVGVGMGSGSIAAAGGGALAGTAGMFGISGLDIQTKLSAHRKKCGAWVPMVPY